MLILATDAILVIVVLEAVALTLLHRVGGRGPAPGPLMPTLAAGFSLVLALRVALGGAAPALVAACLLASLVAHLADLAVRWPRRGSRP